MTPRRRCCPALILVIVGLAWLGVLVRQHSLVDKLMHDYALSDLMSSSDSSSIQQLRSRIRQDQELMEEPSTVTRQQQEEVGPVSPKSNISMITRPRESNMFFNSYHLTLMDGPPRSTANCLDEAPPQFQNISWQFTSCRYTNLCLNIQTNQYGLVMADDETTAASDTSSLPVALGGINPRWDVGTGPDRGSYKVQWSPERILKPTASYYQLPDNVVMVPFNSFAGHNVGHLLWDDFFAIFRLLQLHGLVGGDDNNRHNLQLLPIRQVLEEKLYATCDIRRNKRLQCMSNFAKFLPLMGVDPVHFSSHKKFNFTGNGWPQSPLVCAKQAVAGLGMLTDHGKRDHGWERRRDDELVIPHMLGKGRLFWEFRLFVLQNLGMEETSAPVLQNKQPQITFSLQSSRDWDRRLDFSKQIHALQTATSPSPTVRIRPVTFWDMSLTDQIQMALDSHIFVSTCGGGSITASFLPRGASLILFYNETGGLDFETFQSNGAPARLDWDLLGNAAHLRVHWLPIGSMDTDDDLTLFVQLIRHELRIIRAM